jgi:hypothetical protein
VNPKERFRQKKWHKYTYLIQHQKRREYLLNFLRSIGDDIGMTEKEEHLTYLEQIVRLDLPADAEIDGCGQGFPGADECYWCRIASRGSVEVAHYRDEWVEDQDKHLIRPVTQTAIRQLQRRISQE